MNDMDIFLTLMSGAAHDIDHPGSNNLFETKTRSKLAILYNDQSVLENHHSASFFFLLDNPKTNCNIFKGFSEKERGDARKAIVENILCTDMSKHMAIQTELKNLLEKPEDQR